jgi:hypothetical protein
MAVKYVKDFGFDSSFGFSGSSGKTPVKSHMRSPMKKADGGAVKSKGFDNSTRNPISKFPDIAPAMVGKRSKGLGGLASETKKLDAYDKPHAEGKKGAKVAQYAKGGAVKKAHAKKEMPSFLKAKMMKKAEGGPVAEITEGDGMSPLQAMAESDLRVPPLPPVKREFVMPPEFNEEGMRVGPDRGGSRMYDPTRDAILEQTLPPLPPPELTPLEGMPFGPRESGPSMERWSDGTYHFMPEESGQRTPLEALPITYRRMSEEALANKPLAPKRLPAPIEPDGSGGGGGSSDVGIGGLFGGMPAPSPLARAAMPTKADRMATRRDNMMAARDIMDRYIGGERNAMPRRSMAPGMRGMAEGKARRAMPVAPRAPMIQLPRAPRGGVATFAKGGKVSKGEKKIGKVMGEFKRGELHSGSKKGPVVTNPKQAKAIALSEARAAGAKVPKKRAMGGRACG